MKKGTRKLTLARETIDRLTRPALREVGGAGTFEAETCAPCRIETWPNC